ncbi:MAG: amidohydrolase [Bacteroidaceae bacterium]|nr:amidohydrolase [Bacteroidaceae bacterium]
MTKSPSPANADQPCPIIDAHSHLWLRQDTVVDGQPIRTLDRGRSLFFGEERQMLPPFMIDGKNSAEVFLANMDYAQVGGAVVVQEFIDGIQNDYLAEVEQRYPQRFVVCGMPEWRQPGFYEQSVQLADKGFRALALPGHRLPVDAAGNTTLGSEEMHRVAKMMEERGFIFSVCLADNPRQIAEMREIIEECPRLKVAIGHFGMPTENLWHDQILLARHTNVMVESGGITWLYNSEFYPFPTAMQRIREAADLVGIDHLMWGSDYPRTITAITYRMSYDFVRRSSLLTPDEQTAFLGLNAQRFYGFGKLPELPYIKNMSE